MVMSLEPYTYSGCLSIELCEIDLLLRKIEKLRDDGLEVSLIKNNINTARKR